MNKTKYKQTEIGKIPEEWEVVEIRELGEVSTGKTPPTSIGKYWEGDIPFITPADLSNSKYVEVTERKVTPEGAELVGILPKNTVMVVCIGSTIGKTGILKKQGITNQQINSIVCKEGVDSEYVYYTLDKAAELFKNYSGIAAVPILNKSLFEKIKIPLPPFPEQKAIAEVISTIDCKIDITERERERVERLKVGLMKQLFDGKKWKLLKITELFDVETGTTPSTKIKEYWDNGNVSWITPADMNDLDNDLNLPESNRKITQKALKEANLILMPIGSIVISTRAPVGYVGIVKKELTFNQGCKGLIPKDKSNVNTIFYAYYLRSMQEYLNNISGGSTFKELSKDSLSKLEITFPPISEQNRIAEILLTVDQKLSMQHSKKSKLEGIKKQLMDDLLTGKKRVKVTG